MFNIDQLLQRFKSSRNDDIRVRSIVAKVLKEKVLLDIPLESVDIKPPRIFLKNIPQAARSEIYIKKESILAEINKVHSGRALTDIK